MTPFTFFSKFILSLSLIAIVCSDTKAQSDTLVKKKTVDTSRLSLNMDATYSRPFTKSTKYPMAIGGYVEANSLHSTTDGVSEGLSFQMRRMTLFFSSTIAKRIKFLAELELEDGTKELNLEYAAIDVEMNALLNIRGGILMNPIGGFNQNHDGPRWDFIDRPFSSTTIIPSTLSNVGFGLYGKTFLKRLTLGYEIYLTNGFNDQIISNTENRTSLAAAKLNPNRFEESPNGVPMITSKVALRHRKLGELGLSFMNGTYNTFEIEGLSIDKQRKVNVLALDFNSNLLKNKIALVGEIVKVMVDVPETYSQTFGNAQFGGFMDLAWTFFQKPIKFMGWDKAKINAVVRFDYADYNQGKFKETQTNIYDNLWAITPGIALRPVGSTVIRFNYRYLNQTDLLGNPPLQTGTILLGFSSYF